MKDKLFDVYASVKTCYCFESTWEALNEYYELSNRVFESLCDGKSIDEDDEDFLNFLYPDSPNVIQAALANLNGATDDLKNFIKMNNATFIQKVVYIDMDDTLCDFKGAFLKQREIKPSLLWPHSQEGFFEELIPLPGAIETIELLIKSDLYDPYILTAPSVRNPNSYSGKRIWIEKYFGLEFCKKLILSPNKSLLVGDYLIDDNVSGKGQDGFSGHLIHFGSNEYPDWFSVRSFLEI